MKRLSLVAAVLVLAACSAKEQAPATDSAAPAMTPAPAPAAAPTDSMAPAAAPMDSSAAKADTTMKTDSATKKP